MTDKLQTLVAHDKAQKALIASQAAEIAERDTWLQEHEDQNRRLIAEIARLHESDHPELVLAQINADLRAEIARLKAFCTELFEHLEYCGWGDAWERECSADLRKRAHANEGQQP